MCSTKRYLVIPPSPHKGVSTSYRAPHYVLSQRSVRILRKGGYTVKLAKVQFTRKDDSDGRR